MFLENIKSALGTKYAGFGLSKEAVDAIALQVEKTVEKEEDVESNVANYDTMFLVAKEVQKMRDRELRTRSDLQKSFDSYKEAHPEKTGDPDPDKEEPSELENRLKALEAKMAADEKKILNESRLAGVKTEVEKKCKDAPILKQVLKGFSFKEEETDEAAIERITGEYNETVKEIRGEGYIPPYGRETTNPYKKGDDDAFVESLRREGSIPSKE